MSKVFAINAGSSSLKFSIYEVPSEEVISSGIIERIGLKDSIVSVKFQGEKHEETLDIEDHEVAINHLLKKLEELKVIESFDEIAGSGHRIVAGGEHFKDSALLDEEDIQKVEELADFAPLHNPAEAKVIRAFQKVLPGKPTVGVFDTSFHTTMPEKAYLYSVPFEYYEKHQARRYGAHGTSHKYVAERAAELEGKDIKDLKIITCHIGNGGSITAVDGGKSVDTSMGFTPLAGITMGTRSGDVDASLLQYIMEKESLSMDEMITILNKKSGLLGISGVSSDMRDVEAAAAEGNERAQVALDIYYDRVRKYVGSYLTVLGGADVIVFTAGVGENSASFREEICKDMEWAGIKLDSERNDTRDEAKISADDSKVAIWTIPTDEELMIVRDTVRLGNI
ncbi:acetate kinase [Aerococcus sp. UMB10185]|uniref:acetate/propionate family kinase n=1 Tax=unclassified Aerococcus TaxID=2618060 RepID=UPI0008A13518|nr:MULTISPECIES: acetate kinase [unclassified Aerococcus]KAB0646790.1 acetate kinase [Aerococcus sanguinicola]MDK6234295.1 acetate kinase [Aerococcus sp. UMB10185]MDK6855481.1 acetate kinase [Aerococcus sp. UMB7533]MDK8501659.1 acetate kinase [Aerococcus sp. UMB1112A]OFN00560.1 acetate kinase [Aerococcus sp. HMSC062A02]